MSKLLLFCILTLVISENSALGQKEISEKDKFLKKMYSLMFSPDVGNKCERFTYRGQTTISGDTLESPRTVELWGEISREKSPIKYKIKFSRVCKKDLSQVQYVDDSVVTCLFRYKQDFFEYNDHPDFETIEDSLQTLIDIQSLTEENKLYFIPINAKKRVAYKVLSYWATGVIKVKFSKSSLRKMKKYNFSEEQLGKRLIERLITISFFEDEENNCSYQLFDCY